MSPLEHGAETTGNMLELQDRKERCEMLSSGCDMAIKFTSSQQQLWFPPQDPHKMKLSEILMQEFCIISSLHTY